MPERPGVPPTRKPVSEFPTPDPSVAFYTELVNRDDPAYMANQPVKRGQLYANMVGAKREVISTYPNLFFLRERKFQLSDQQVLWDWATDQNADDTYNSEVTYVANAVPYPAFTRVYTVRRELYESDPTSVIGSPLPGIIAVEITSPGQNHTQAVGIIDGTTVEIEFTVSPNGGLINGIITNTGQELIQNGTAITIIGDGQDSSAIAVSQPTGCVLTAQKKEELPDADPQSHELVKVTRVYETLPGPWIYTTKIDKDGMFVTIKTRRQIADFIVDEDVILNGEWSQTWHKGTDNFVAEENIETRPIPGNPIIDTKVSEDGKILTTTKTLVDTTALISSETLVAGVWTKNFGQEVDDSTLIKVHQASNKVSWQMSEARVVPGNPMVDTRVEEDGKVTTITKTLKDTTLISSGEVISGGNWIRTHKEEVSDLVANEVVESRPIPGNGVKSTRVDEDGIEVDITKTLRQTTTITTQETLVLGVWTKEHVEAVSDLVAWDVVEVRAIPGNPLVDIKMDKDGVARDVIKTLKDSSLIIQGEVIGGGGVWITTEKEAVSDLVAKEVVTARTIPGNPILSYKIDQDHETVFQQTVLRERATITPSATESGGNITTVEAEEVTDLVANEVTKAVKFLDAASYSISIVNLIPREFMSKIPTKIESHVLSGTASQPTIGFLQFEVSEKQLTKLLYERRVTTIDAPVLPTIHTNQETTELYGGGILNVNFTLAILGSIGIDQGYLIPRSSLTDLGNGLVVKETAQLNDTAWPTETGVAFDQDMQIVYPFEEQVVPTTYTVTTGSFILETLEPIDDWRSKRKKVTKSPINVDSSTAMVTIRYHPFRFPGLLTTALAGYYVRASDSQLCKHTIRTWWQDSPGTPSVSVDEIIMDDPIISALNNNTQLAYAGPCIHDAFTSFGVLFWPATTPTYTDYIATWKNNEKIIAASVDKTDIPNLWKVQTISVIMR